MYIVHTLMWYYWPIFTSKVSLSWSVWVAWKEGGILRQCIKTGSISQWFSSWCIFNVYINAWSCSLVPSQWWHKQFTRHIFIPFLIQQVLLPLTAMYVVDTVDSWWVYTRGTQNVLELDSFMTSPVSNVLFALLVSGICEGHNGVPLSSLLTFC